MDSKILESYFAAKPGTRKSLYEQDLTTLDKFIDEVGIRGLGDEQFKSFLTRLGQIAEVLGVDNEEVVGMGILLSKAREGILTDDEADYLTKMVGQYFRERYEMLRYTRRFVEADKPVGDSEGNILLAPLASALLGGGFLARIADSNENDFQKILDNMKNRAADIIGVITDSPVSGAKSVNKALLDGLAGSSYANMPEPGETGEGGEQLTTTEWYKTYSEPGAAALQAKIDATAFRFDLSTAVLTPEGEEGAAAGQESEGEVVPEEPEVEAGKKEETPEAPETPEEEPEEEVPVEEAPPEEA